MPAQPIAAPLANRKIEKRIAVSPFDASGSRRMRTGWAMFAALPVANIGELWHRTAQCEIQFMG